MSSTEQVEFDSPSDESPIASALSGYDSTSSLAVAEVIERLRKSDLAQSEARRLVVAAETLPIDENLRTDFLAALREFICKHRDSNDPEDLIAVGAAIRKVVLCTPHHEIESLASLLESGHRAAVPLDIELEIAKAVVWKLTAQPAQAPNQFPQLADQMWNLAQTYLHDRLLPRDKYAAAALNAGLALLLMQSHVAEVIDLVNDLRLAWFKELFARRAKRIGDELAERSPGEGGALVGLEQATVTLQPVAL